MTVESTLPGTPLAELADALPGSVVIPGEEGWDRARRAWNLASDQRPDAVVIPARPGDVSALIRFATHNGLRVVAQGTGHLSAPLGDLAGSILIQTRSLKSIEVDAGQRVVRVGAGVLWSEVTSALAVHGLMALSGSSGDVGVVGYLLGGGYSWFARSYGLAVNRVTAIDLVTADGRELHATEDSESDLFWALRGGGGNFGVVTAISFEVFPMTDTYAGMLLFPLERARVVLGAFERWTRQVDASATTCIRLLRIPPVPDAPEFLRGNAFVAVDGAIDLPDADAEQTLAPLRALGPVADTFRRLPVSQLASLHMDPPGPVSGVSDGTILDDLPPAAIDAILGVAGAGRESSLLTVDLRQLGGAVGQPVSGGGAVDHLSGRFALYAVGMAPTPGRALAVERDIHQLLGAVRPWRAGTDYSNLCDTKADPRRFWDEHTLERLRTVKRRYDPGNVIRSSHELYITKEEQ